MAFDVEHLFGIDVSPAWEEVIRGPAWASLDDDRQDELLFGTGDGGGAVHRIYDQEKVVVGAKVPVGPRGVLVTDEVEVAATRAFESLPEGLAEAIRAGMARRHARWWGIPAEDEAEWLAGRVPAPRFHVCPYRG